MAYTHFQISPTSTHGPQLRNALTTLETGYQNCLNMLGTIPTMIDGDGSQVAHFAEVTARFGFQSDAQSKAAWEELQSMMSKLTGDGSVTFVNAALKQAWNKFR